MTIKNIIKKNIFIFPLFTILSSHASATNTLNFVKPVLIGLGVWLASHPSNGKTIKTVQSDQSFSDRGLFSREEILHNSDLSVMDLPNELPHDLIGYFGDSTEEYDTDNHNTVPTPFSRISCSPEKEAQVIQNNRDVPLTHEAFANYREKINGQFTYGLNVRSEIDEKRKKLSNITNQDLCKEYGVNTLEDFKEIIMDPLYSLAKFDPLITCVNSDVLNKWVNFYYLLELKKDLIMELHSSKKDSYCLNKEIFDHIDKVIADFYIQNKADIDQAAETFYHGEEKEDESWYGVKKTINAIQARNLTHQTKDEGAYDGSAHDNKPTSIIDPKVTQPYAEISSAEVQAPSFGVNPPSAEVKQPSVEDKDFWSLHHNKIKCAAYGIGTLGTLLYAAKKWGGTMKDFGSNANHWLKEKLGIGIKNTVRIKHTYSQYPIPTKDPFKTTRIGGKRTGVHYERARKRANYNKQLRQLTQVRVPSDNKV